MSEKILTVLVVVSLVLSVFNIVLLLRTNDTNTITNIAEPTVDSRTARADSFELEILFTYGSPSTLDFVRINETELSTWLQEDRNNNQNYTLTTLDKTTFLNDFYAQMDAANIQTEGDNNVVIFRCQNTFYINIGVPSHYVNGTQIEATYVLGYCTP